MDYFFNKIIDLDIFLPLLYPSFPIEIERLASVDFANDFFRRARSSAG